MAWQKHHHVLVTCSWDVHDFDFEFECSLGVLPALPPCPLNQWPKVFAGQQSHPPFVPHSHHYLRLLASHFHFSDPHLPITNHRTAYGLQNCWSFLSSAVHRVTGFHKENKKWEAFHI